MPDSRWSDDQIDQMIKHMEQGHPIAHIADMAGMPSADSMTRWSQAGDELAERIARARDLGWDKRAADAVSEAKDAEDAGLGRLAFDAERWFLAKMKPRTYGEATMMKLADADGGKLDLASVVAARRAQVAEGKADE